MQSSFILRILLTLAPAAFAVIAIIIPMGPAPITKAVSPNLNSDLDKTWKPTANGSARAAI
ncbi:MAG TPA: hypothetical protein GXX37_15620 [Clostridiaceae bacterium]|nr:hypothetical protein [Clostridiaceae bacterium]